MTAFSFLAAPRLSILLAVAGAHVEPFGPALGRSGCGRTSEGCIWDIHFWLGSSGVPSLSILKPGRPIRGWDPQAGTAFFYPLLTPPTTQGTDGHAA